MLNNRNIPKVFIVFLGQNRFFSVFENELKKIRKYSSSDFQIYYQYDEGSLTGAEIRILKSYNVTLREVKEVSEDTLLEYDPNLLNRGGSELRKMGGGLRRATIWRQLIDLKSFLNFVDNNCSSADLLIRMRPDYSMSASFYQQLSLDLAGLFPNANSSSVFNKKIWVMWASAVVPFYIHDAVFGGTIGDINKLVDVNNNSVLKEYYPGTPLPLFFFVRPFIDNRHIGDALRILKTTPFTYELLSDKKYSAALAEYHNELSNSFNVKFFDSRWHVQWLQGRSVKRIWLAFNWTWNFKILPFLLTPTYLSPFAMEVNDTFPGLQKKITLLPHKTPKTAILINEYIVENIFFRSLYRSIRSFRSKIIG